MKILYVTTIGKTMRFFTSFIKLLIDEGHQVELAANEINSPVPECYREWNCKFHHIGFSRSPLSFDNVKAYGLLKKVVEEGNYDIVHCHTPNASVITRLVCRKYRKRGLKVFYTAHGFHFYKGAPKLNWLVFYPVEKFCSRFTDKLITINQEDYALARERFHAREVHYVPGVGIDLSRFENVQVDRTAKRQEIGVPENAFLLLSVGELNENKNHQVVIRALAKLNDPNVHYAIAGVGGKREYLLELAEELGVSAQVHLLGYRTDIPELNCAADIFCFPSIREGLAVSVMEAMACNVPCVVSKIRGNTDLIDENGGFLFSPRDEDGCVSAITSVMNENRYDVGIYNGRKVQKFGTSAVIKQLRSLYCESV